jgi:capsular polysaccharide biosynthesis protein
MELRQYWNVIWKRRWLVLAIVLVATVASAIMALTAKRYFQTETKFITRQEPSPDTLGPGLAGSDAGMIFTFNRYYNWFGSEFLVDDYTQIVESDAFAGSVLDTMKQAGFAQSVIDELNKHARENVEEGKTAAQLGPEMVENLQDDIAKLKLRDVKEGIGADRTHRELHLTIVGPTGEMAKAIADASAIVLANAQLKPIRGELVDDKPMFSQIDDSRAETIQSSRSREIINALIRVIIAAALALALVFLLEYLDNSVRDERDATKVMDLPVLGAIPRG